jgi:hypothetical protein
LARRIRAVGPQQAIALRFNVTIYTEYESAIAVSEEAFSELTRAFINILDSGCYAIFQKQKSW